MRRLNNIISLIMTLALVIGHLTVVEAQAAGDSIVVSTPKELNNALKSGNYSKVTLRTDETVTIKIKAGEYGDVKLVIDAPNAKIKNNASEKKVYILAAKKFTEYASGNTISIRTEKTSFVAAEGAAIKTLGVTKEDASVKITNNGSIEKVTVKKNAEVDLKQNGTLEKIYLKAETDLSVNGTSEKQVKLAVYEGASGSKIESSITVKAVAYADTVITLTEGAESSNITVKNSDIEVEVQNKTEAKISITDFENGVTNIAAGEEAKVKGDEVVAEEHVQETIPEPTQDPLTTENPVVSITPVPNVQPIPTSVTVPDPVYVPSEYYGSTTTRSFRVSYESANALVKIYSPMNVEIDKGHYLTENSSVYALIMPEDGYVVTSVTAGDVNLVKEASGYYIIDSLKADTVINVATVKSIPSIVEAELSKNQLSVDPDKNDSVVITVNVYDQFRNVMKGVMLEAYQDENSKESTGMITMNTFTDNKLIISGSDIDITGNGETIGIIITIIRDKNEDGDIVLTCPVELSLTDVKDPTLKTWSDYLKDGGRDYEIFFPDKALEQFIKTRICGKTVDDSIMLSDVYEKTSLNITGKFLVMGNNGIPAQTTVADLSGIEKMVNLKVVNILGQGSVDARSLALLDNLIAVTINDSSSNGSTVELGTTNEGRFKSLQILHIQNCSVKDFSFLKGLPKLTNIVFRNCGLTDVSYLESLPNLKSLTISNSNISDIAVLNQLSELTHLSISGCNISDYSTIFSLPSLKSIGLDISAQEEFTKLKNIPGLTGITINGTLNDVSWLIQHKDLENLSISPASYEAISGILKEFHNIKSLSISDCVINDTSVISGLTTLEELYLTDCGLEDISEFAKLTALNTLFLDRNNITDISSILTLPKLTSVSLSDVGMIEEKDLESLKNKCVTMFNYSPSSEAAQVFLTFESDNHVSLSDITLGIDRNYIVVKPDEYFEFTAEPDEGYECYVTVIDSDSAFGYLLPGSGNNKYSLLSTGWGNLTISVKAFRKALYTIKKYDGVYLSVNDNICTFISKGSDDMVFEALVQTDDGSFMSIRDIKDCKVMSSNENVLIVMNNDPQSSLTLLPLNTGSSEIIIMDASGQVISICPVQVVNEIIAVQNDGIINLSLNNVEIDDTIFVATGGAILVQNSADILRNVDMINLEKIEVDYVTQQNVQVIVDAFIGVRRVIVPKNTDISRWKINSVNTMGQPIYVSIQNK